MGTESWPQAAAVNSQFDPDSGDPILDPGFDRPGHASGVESAAPIDNTLRELIESELSSDAPSFQFFQAVALLQRMRPESRPVGHFYHPASESLYFRANQRLGFPASQIQQLNLSGSGPADMMVNFMGLTGPEGVLPYTYSELILERARAKDHSLAAFLDIFNNRAIALFYRAWQKSRFPVTFGSAQDLFSQYLLDLLGLGTAGLRDRQQIEDEALQHYISLVAMQTRSAVALEQVLADYFEVPVDIEQFTGSWYTISPDTQCKMVDEESPSIELGNGAIAGDAIWDRQGRVRIRVGPLSLDRYNDFLPGGGAYDAVRAITRFFGNDTLDFELQLVLDRGEAPNIELEGSAIRLGWVSWLKTKRLAADPDDTVLAL